MRLLYLPKPGVVVIQGTKDTPPTLDTLYVGCSRIGVPGRFFSGIVDDCYEYGVHGWLLSVVVVEVGGQHPVDTAIIAAVKRADVDAINDGVYHCHAIHRHEMIDQLSVSVGVHGSLLCLVLFPLLSPLVWHILQCVQW